MDNKKIIKHFNTFVHILEFIVAIFIILIVIAGFIEIVLMCPLRDLIFGNVGNFQGAFQGILSDVLLLIVGIELALLLIKRNPDYLIEIMLFVIARKLLINSDEIWELAVGILALAAIFAVRKFLICKSHTNNPM